jgi:putative Holliday junction resolvase
MDVAKIVVGLPTTLGGHEGPSAEEARTLGKDLHNATDLPVVYHDERFTSRMAESTLLADGMKRRDRRQKVDKIAAAIILQDYLDNQ